jgi:transposase-like protein
MESKFISVELFLKDLARKCDRHRVWTDGAEWYSLACESMNLTITFTHITAGSGR